MADNQEEWLAVRKRNERQGIERKGSREMKEIKFTHLYLENFCGVKKLDTDLYDNTIVCGKNGVGKSTIKNAIYWVLFNKMSDGSAPDGIRPHDENNVNTNDIEITAILTMGIDGKQVEFKKVQKQKWTKHHGDDEKTFEGNVNSFEINQIPKNEKVFKSYIEDNISLDTFYDCTNPVAFFGLNTKKRREKLMTLESKVTNEDVIQADSRFSLLENDLTDGTVEELITRSKQIIKRNNEKLSTIPARIDEVSKQKVDIDVAELELMKKALNEELKNVRNDLEDSSHIAKERSKLQDTHMQLQFKLGDIQRDANAENEKKRKDITRKIADIENQIREIESERDYLCDKRSMLVDEISEKNNLKNKYADEWKLHKEKQFDEKYLACPYCHQDYPSEKQEEIKKEFEKSKQMVLDNIVEKGNKVKTEIKECECKISAYDKRIEVDTREVLKLEEKKENEEKELKLLPTTIDVSDTEEYKEVEEQIHLLEEKINSPSDFNKIKENLKFREQDILKQLSSVNEKFVMAENNNKIDKRIEELEEEEKKIGQQQADEQQKLDLLTEFNNAKMKLLSEKVNSHFDILKFQLFRPLINGGTEDCCMALVNGTSYDGLLNTGNKILANIDICHAFQKKNKIKLPIIVDDTESLDSDKIPDVGSQMILLRRVDKKGLEIKKG